MQAQRCLPTKYGFIDEGEQDYGAISSLLDLCPGMRVLEVGTGSGALTMHMARAVGSSGSSAFVASFAWLT